MLTVADIVIKREGEKPVTIKGVSVNLIMDGPANTGKPVMFHAHWDRPEE